MKKNLNIILLLAFSGIWSQLMSQQLFNYDIGTKAALPVSEQDYYALKAKLQHSNSTTNIFEQIKSNDLIYGTEGMPQKSLARIEIPIGDEPFNTTIERGGAQEYSILGVVLEGANPTSIVYSLSGTGSGNFDITHDDVFLIGIVPGQGTVWDIWFTMSTGANTPVGTYTVKLEIFFLNRSNQVVGLSRKNIINITVTGVAQPPVANFIGSPTSGNAPLTVNFTDQSSGNITSRSWDFGDGQSSTLQNPSHTYPNAGTYTVKLTVTGSGGSSTKTRSGYISVTEPPSLMAVTFYVQTPPSTPPNDKIYLAGSFNYWDPGPAQAGTDGNEHDITMTNLGANRFQLTMQFDRGRFIEYKFTRGSWEKVEKGAQGEEISNRTLTIPAGNYTQQDTVANWADIVVPNPPAIVAPPNGAMGVKTSLTLRWRKSIGAMKYNYQVSVDPNFDLYTIRQGSVSDTFVVITDLPEASRHYWRVSAANAFGNGQWGNVWNFSTGFSTSVSEQSGTIPSEYAVEQNHPNPFNPETTIKYKLPTAGHVRLSIYNTLGHEVRVLVDGVQSASQHSAIWNGRDDRGNSMPSGVYFYHIQAGEFADTKKMVLAR